MVTARTMPVVTGWREASRATPAKAIGARTRSWVPWRWPWARVPTRAPRERVSGPHIRAAVEPVVSRSGRRLAPPRASTHAVWAAGPAIGAIGRVAMPATRPQLTWL
jgi:hypothetical protein